ncbi:MAG TPA: polysaccharide biosynthesis/export family protein [Bauldia sp.]|jgi:polysaccharide export outer membrane protein|nr:polysaccharide biosynthesis/export family protein [Bauldia sp.]
MLRHVSILLACGIASACSTLPSTGPTGRDISHAARAQDQLPFRIVEVATPEAIPPVAAVPAASLSAVAWQPTDLIGPSDVLSITIYEAGVSLFGRPATRVGATANSNMPADQSATSERLAGVRVDDQGFIRLPFVGRLRAAGHTTGELQSMIRNGLKGMSQDPQVLVSVEQSVTNSVVMAGEVSKPGRFVLVTNRETLNDTIALAGGYKGEPKDLVARVERDGRDFEIRLSDLMDLPQRDLSIAPGDRITLISRPQSFSVLGAPNRAEQIRFPRGRVSLAEAVALAGGANPSAGDAGAIFVFRYVSTTAGVEEPVVYHVNMMKPGALLLSQRFMMNDKDLLYVGNAQANQPSKFIQLVSQLFVPVVYARSTLQ